MIALQNLIPKVSNYLQLGYEDVANNLFPTTDQTNISNSNHLSFRKNIANLLQKKKSISKLLILLIIQ